MARIGNRPIKIREGVSVEVSDDNRVTVEGPEGELTTQIDPEMTVTVGDGAVRVARPSDQKRHRSLHGLSRSLIENMIEGVTEGYKKELKIIGVGYRAEVNNGVLELALGFSHPIYFLPPDGIDVSVETREKNPVIVIEGIDKQLVGQVAAKIRGLRPPEPYKGKGIRYVGEHVERKAGKTAAR